jgi:uncharacterized membrane protein YeaQ/YmgE (transglycosylase-associated protein family)
VAGLLQEKRKDIERRKKMNNLCFLLWFLIIGGVAGWLAGLLVKGRGLGGLGNILVGCIGAVIGGGLFSLLGVSSGGGLIGSLITAFIGAVVLLFIIGLIKKR